MNVLSIYLWKEWREQRATLGLLALALALGTAVVVATLPRSAAGDPLTFLGVVAFSAAATVLSVGADLLARERESGLRFLERQPAGLAAAFRAKLAFLVLAMGAAMTFGMLLASCAAWLRGGAPPALDLAFAQPLGLLLVLSLWTFAVSAWMPSSALTLPATALLLAALAWPALPVILRHPAFRPSETQVWTFAALGVLGAPASAWAAFVVGSRAGRTRRAAAIAGLAVAALAFAPSWVWAALRWHAARNTPYELGPVWVGIDGQIAFANARRPESLGDDEMLFSALRIDLRDGSWTFAGERDASFFNPTARSMRLRIGPETPTSGPLQLVKDRADPRSEVLVDPIGGEIVEREPESDANDVSPADFGLEVPPRSWHVTRVGLGLRLTYYEADGGGPFVSYLAPDGRILRQEELPRDAYGHAIEMLQVRPGPWLARDARAWSLFDPESGTIQPLEFVARNEFLGPLLDDGRALLVSDSCLHLLDLDSGERRPVAVDAPAPPHIRSVSSTDGVFGCVPADRPVLVVVFAGRTSHLGWLDAQAATLRLGPSCGDLHLGVLWSEGKRAIVLEELQRIALHDLERNERRVIFDVADVR